MDLVTDLSLDDEVFSVDVDTDPILRHDQQLEGSGEVIIFCFASSNWLQIAHFGRNITLILNMLTSMVMVEDERVNKIRYDIAMTG